MIIEMADSEYTGDDLLQIFQQLNVNSAYLSSNVIRGWFDTDDQDMKDLLHWMCSSLTENNCLPGEVQLEYTQLERVLEGSELEEQVNKVDSHFPGIFQYESNLQEVEWLQDENEILKERQAACDMELKINKAIDRKLLTQLSELQTDEIKSEIKKEEAQESCEKLSEDLDNAKNNLSSPVIKYQQYLHNFLFNLAAPQCFNIAELEEKFKGAVNCLNCITEVDNMLEVNTNDDSCDLLSNIRNRMFQSSWKYLINKLEVAKLKSAIQFLANYDTTHISVFRDEKVNGNLQNDQVTILFKMVKNLLEKRADNDTNRSRLWSAQNELKAYQSRLGNLAKIEQVIIQVLILYIEMRIIYSQEKSDIDGSEIFLKKVADYVNQDIQNCIFRKEAMEEVIKNHQDFNSAPVEKKVKLIRILGSLLTDVEAPSLTQILKASDSLNAEIAKLETKLFVEIPKQCAQTFKNLHANIEVLEKFLVCGPTCRVVTVPRPLQLVFAQADSDLEKQNRSVKSATHSSSEALKKLAENLQLRNRRQLWMHFVNNPSKLALMFQSQQ